ncbi:MAG TPA: hypothetical protein VK918_06800 [Pyrinomonadaceae bacterium]|nr:hypothetical protein [Pyrinomonadaceae bacterium]
MTGSRAQFDADRYEEPGTFSTVKSAAQPHEVKCDICNRALFIGPDEHAEFLRKAEQNVEQAYLCDDCRFADDERVAAAE